MRFYLGTHMPNWLATAGVPLFVSRRRLVDRKVLPVAATRWALDSGGFTELNLFGRWSFTEEAYVRDVRRFANEVGELAWVAPMDWMCEPSVRAKTGLSVDRHQRLTIGSFDYLREQLGELVIPVLQGWERDDYLRHVEMYERVGLDLTEESLVGVGSVCRRGQDEEIHGILRSLDGLNLHAFGLRSRALGHAAHHIESADSLAWSYAARRDRPLLGHTHKSCANCLPYALRWRDRQLDRIGLFHEEVAA